MTTKAPAGIGNWRLPNRSLTPPSFSFGKSNKNCHSSTAQQRLIIVKISVSNHKKTKHIDDFDLWCLMPLSAIFQLYHGDQFQWWKKPEYPQRNTDQATGKLYHLRLRVECTLFLNLQSRAQTHAVFVIGLYELLGNPTTLSHPGFKFSPNI